jgi:hypothetical protein
MRSRRQYYDEVMIRDFLRHLRAEVAVGLMQVAPNGQTPSRELLAELAWFTTKYDVCGLLSTMEADTSRVPQGYVEPLLKDVRAARARELEAALKALDALAPVLAEAFLSLREPHRPPKRRIKLADLMERLRTTGLENLGTAAC